MQKFAESVALGQGKQLFDQLNAESSSDDDEHSIPDDIMPFLNTYDHSDKKGNHSQPIRPLHIYKTTNPNIPCLLQTLHR